MFAALATLVAAAGWWEALHLDVTRSLTFARPGQPIETGWQPIAVGITALVIGAGTAQGIIRRGFASLHERLFLRLLLAGMLALALFGAAGIFAGIEAFALLEDAHGGARP